MPDFKGCTITWSAHALRRAGERGVTVLEAERVIRESHEQEETRLGRWITWGCVAGRRIKVVIKPAGHRCFVISIVRTGMPCI